MKLVVKDRTLNEAAELINNLLLELGFEKAACTPSHYKAIKQDDSHPHTSLIDILLTDVNYGSEINILVTEFSHQFATFHDDLIMEDLISTKFLLRHSELSELVAA